MRPFPEESIFSTLSPCSSCPISSDVPFGAAIMIIDLAQSCRQRLMVWQILMRSSQVMQWNSRISSLSRNYRRIWLLSSCILESSDLSSSFMRSSLVLSSTISRSTSGSSLPPIHLMVFFCIFSTQLMPSRTLVMSQMRLFCTLRRSTATLRSMVMFSLFLMRSINFLVRTDRLLSCLPLPLYLLPLLLALSSSSSSSSLRSYYNLGVGFLLIRLPILVNIIQESKLLFRAQLTLKIGEIAYPIELGSHILAFAPRFINWPQNWEEQQGVRQKQGVRKEVRYSDGWLSGLGQQYNMGNLFKKKEKQSNLQRMPTTIHVAQVPVPQPPQQKPRQKFPRKRLQPKTIFKEISLNKRTALEKSYYLNQLLRSDRWNINPQIIEHLRILNAFQLITTSCAQVLQVQLHTQLLFPQPQNIQSIEQEYSSIYASMFHVDFTFLRKLNIRGKKVNADKEGYSLEVLQYLKAPALEELHADGHNLTSISFLRKCNWKELRTLSIRDTKIADSQHFARVLPYLANSQHIQILNLASQMSTNWYQVSWILKMGYKNAIEQRIRMDNDDEYFSRNDDRVLRRVEFGIMSKGVTRGKHLRMIGAKFNNTYFDNPLALY